MLAFSLTAAMRHLRLLLLAAALAVTPWLQPIGDAQQPAAARSPRNASYLLRAELDPGTRTITGSGLLTWRNIAAVPATELRFHLYWNAWRNSASSWMREQQRGRDTSLAERPEEDWGWIDLSALRLVSGDGNIDLLAGARFIAPDDGNSEDRTVLAVPLDEPVEPGASVTIDLAWQARVPRTFSRTGTIGDYFFIAQWFPKIGVLEDTGWNCHQFHAAT